MIDTARLITILVQAGGFISTFAAISAGIVMASITQKFGMGILATGFKTNSIGIFFIAAGIATDAALSYIQINGFVSVLPPVVTIALLSIKYLFFVIGTYTIVIGSKKTGDRIESLTK